MSNNIPTHTATLVVSFFQESDGWMHLNLIVGGVEYKLWITGLMPPFTDLLQFLESILTGGFSATCKLDEEGRVKLFSAAAAPDPRLFHFRLSNAYLAEEVFFEALFDRRQFVTTFCAAYTDFLAQDFRPDGWWAEAAMGRAQLARLQTQLAATTVGN